MTWSGRNAWNRHCTLIWTLLRVVTHNWCNVAVDFWTIYCPPHIIHNTETHTTILNYFEIVVFLGRVSTICCEISVNLFGCENSNFSACVANWGIAELDHGTWSCKIWKSNFGAGRQYLTVTKVLLIRSRVDLEFRFQSAHMFVYVFPDIHKIINVYIYVYSKCR